MRRFHSYQLVEQCCTTLFFIQAICARLVIVDVLVQHCGGCDTLLKFHRLSSCLESTVGVLRPSPSFLQKYVFHSRHGRGVFPDVHTLLSTSDSLELWRQTATLRQDTTHGPSQLVHLKAGEQILSDSSSPSVAHHPRNFVCVLHRLLKTVIGCPGLGFSLQSHAHSL